MIIINAKFVWCILTLIRSIYALSTYEQEQDMGSLLGQKNNQTTFERWKDKQIEKMQKGTN